MPIAASTIDSKIFGRVNAQEKDYKIAHNGLLGTLSAKGQSWSLKLVAPDAVDFADPKMKQLLNSDAHPYFMPDFLIAARGRVLPENLKTLLLERKGKNGEQILVHCPVFAGRSALKTNRVLRAADHLFSAIVTPFVAAEDCEQSLEKFAELYSQAMKDGLVPPLCLNFVNGDSRFAKHIEAAAKKAGLGIATYQRGDRPALTSREAFERPSSRKKNLARKRRRLAELGELQFSKAQNQLEIDQYLEAYLQLEADSWKGKKGTALLQQSEAQEFFSAIVPKMVDADQCEICMLSLDGKPIATTVFLNMEGNHFFWKIAFDENYGKYSPGMLLLLEYTEELVKRDDFRMIDSFVGVGPSWTSNIWPDLIDLHKFVIAKTQTKADWIAWQYKTYCDLRDKAKKLVRG